MSGPMIDWLALRIPFKETACELLQTPGRTGDGDARLCGVLTPKTRELLTSLPWYGELDNIHHQGPTTIAEVSRLSVPWGTIPSHYSKVAYKLWHEGKSFYRWPYLEVHCSPAKILTGHNAWGSGDPELCSKAILYAVCMGIPHIESLIDWEETDVRAIDLTCSITMEHASQKAAVLNTLKTLQHKHTKGHAEYETTVYLSNKQSTHRVNKVYDKAVEIEHQIKQLKKNNAPESVIAELERISAIPWVDNALRFETRLKANWFQRRGYSTKLFKKSGLITTLRDAADRQAIFEQAFTDTLESLKGHTMKVLTDHAIEEMILAEHTTYGKNGKPRTTKARHLIAFYRTIETYGYKQIQSEYHKNTFNRQVRYLMDAGISKTQLQSMTSSSTVVPLVRFVTIDFSQQVPPGESVPTMDTLRQLYAA